MLSPASTAAPLASPPTPAVASAPARSRGRLAKLISAVLAFYVLVMVGLIYWRWATIREPSTAVVIAGDGSLQGARILVTGRGHQWAVELDKLNGWQSPILLDPGSYHVQVTHRNRLILDQAFQLTRAQGLRFELPSMVVIVGNSQLAATRIELSRDPDGVSRFEPTEISLSPEEHYRRVVYLYPGLYHATARNLVNDRVIAASDFGVDRTETVRVDLVKAAAEQGAP